jgi:acyl dehydratase
MLFARAKPFFGGDSPAPAKKPATSKDLPERIDDRLGALPDHFARARVGAYVDLGETLFTADFIRDYAQKYDPMPFHTDEEAGKRHLLGGMSASGWQTASCWMRHFIAFRQETAGAGEIPSRASPGFSNLIWRKPVLVGDRIRFSSQVIGKRTTSKPNLGLIRSRNFGVNQRDELVMAFDASVFSPIEE